MQRRAVVTLAVVVIVAGVGVLFVQGTRAWAFTADRHRRAQEIVARESYLYRQLANQDAVLESQRRVYMERFRRLESLLRQREDDVALLRTMIARRVEGQSSSPFTGGNER
jgi:hypothetical protein